MNKKGKEKDKKKLNNLKNTHMKPSKYIRKIENQMKYKINYIKYLHLNNKDNTINNKTFRIKIISNLKHKNNTFYHPLVINMTNKYKMNNINKEIKLKKIVEEDNKINKNCHHIYKINLRNNKKKKK